MVNLTGLGTRISNDKTGSILIGRQHRYTDLVHIGTTAVVTHHTPEILRIRVAVIISLRILSVIDIDIATMLRGRACSAIYNVIRIGRTVQVNARILDNRLLLAVLRTFGMVRVYQYIVDYVIGIVKVRVFVVIIEIMRKLNGRILVLEPVLPAVKGFPLLLVVAQVNGSFRENVILPCFGYCTAKGISTFFVTIINASHANRVHSIILDNHRMGTHVRHPGLRFVVNDARIPFHGQIARLADIGILDYNVLVLPVPHIEGNFRRHFVVVGLRSQNAHINIDVIPVVAHKAAYVLFPVVVGNENLIVILPLGIAAHHALPGENQFQVRLFVGRLRVTVKPTLRVHIERISLQIISVLIEDGFSRLHVYKPHGILRKIEVRRVFWHFSGEADVFYCIYQINLHTLQHRLPYFVVLGHLGCHIHAHRHFTGITVQVDGGASRQNLAAATKRHHRTAAHHKIGVIMTVLPIPTGLDEFGGDGFLFQLGQGGPGENILSFFILSHQRLRARVIYHRKYIALGNVILAGENNAVNDIGRQGQPHNVAADLSFIIFLEDVIYGI